MDDETKEKLDEAIKHHRHQMFPAERWLNVRGEEFTSEEARQALDFDDLIANYGPDDEERIADFVRDFIGEDELKTGHRLWLAEKLPFDDLGIIIMTEDDDRIMRLTKDRCAEERKGDRTIILPGEFTV
jgi:hypothetical protein